MYANRNLQQRLSFKLYFFKCKRVSVLLVFCSKRHKVLEPKSPALVSQCSMCCLCTSLAQGVAIQVREAASGQTVHLSTRPEPAGAGVRVPSPPGQLRHVQAHTRGGRLVEDSSLGAEAAPRDLANNFECLDICQNTQDMLGSFK